MDVQVFPRPVTECVAAYLMTTAWVVVVRGITSSTRTAASSRICVRMSGDKNTLYVVTLALLGVGSGSDWVVLAS